MLMNEQVKYLLLALIDSLTTCESCGSPRDNYSEKMIKGDNLKKLIEVIKGL